MKVLIVGANGQIGKHLVTYMQHHEHIEAVAMIRDEAQAEYFNNIGVETVMADLEDDVDVISAAAAGCDAIVFTAGSGPHTGKDKTLLIDLDGAVKTIQAADQANIKRFIMISSFDTTRAAIQEASDSFAPYVVAKHYADEWLRKTDLDYTIIHPGLLTNDDAIGKITAASTVERNEIPRQDVAKVILTCLDNSTTIGKEFQVVKGSTDITEAINSL